MNKRFWHSTKIFKDFDRGLQDELVNTFLTFDMREKQKRSERRITIPFYNAKGSLGMGTWNDKFFKGYLSFQEFCEICDTYSEIRADVESHRVQMKSLTRSKKVVKVSFGLVLFAFFLFFVALQQWFSFSKELYLAGMLLACIAVISSFVSSLIALGQIPKLEKCINPAFNRLIEYTNLLNEKMKEKHLTFHFDIQLMQLDIIKM